MLLKLSQNSQENTCARVNFIWKETLAQVFLCEFCEISENTFLQNTSGRLLLKSLMLFAVKTTDRIFPWSFKTYVIQVDKLNWIDTTFSRHFLHNIPVNGTSVIDAVGKHSKVSFEICKFYLYKIYLKTKKNFDPANTILKRVE